MSGAPKSIFESRCFSGIQKVFSHISDTLGCKMKFGIFLPSLALTSTDKKFPVIYFLSEENFILKSGFQRYAAEHNLIVVNSDTSPRGLNIEGEDDSYDFGTGAGFYLDATKEPWSKNYRMYSYILDELLPLIDTHFPTNSAKRAIMGHSMGGHGALIMSLKTRGAFISTSAFAPICHPSNCPWGIKAFTAYLGADDWAPYDACSLIANYDGPLLHILVDQGTEDQHLSAGQLFPDHLLAAADRNDRVKVQLRMQKGYDHSYYFVSTFIGDHFAHHAKMLNKD